MQHESDGQPFSESYLNSPEYRERLMRKLNMLIAVLEVATAKVRRSMEGPEADQEKLARIRKNLQATLDVCLRARSALQGRGNLSGELADDLSKVSPELAQSARVLHESGALRDLDVVRPGEWSSRAEALRLAALPRIHPEEVWTCDIDDLAKRLQG